MHSLIRNLTRLDLPIWVRYLAATGAVAMSALAVRILEAHGVYASFTLLIPVVMLVSLVLDRGSGLYAAALASAVAFVALRRAGGGSDFSGGAAWVSLLLFMCATGLAAGLVEGLYCAVWRASASEREKDLRLREASHRIKNNLQTIVSLLRLQRRTLESEEARAALEVALARINVMARLHARLADDDLSDAVDIDRFMVTLCDDLHRAMVGERSIAFAIEADPIPLDCSRAVSMGLIVNELVTNALKYAFPEGREGTIKVAFRRSGEEFQLEVADDGVGIPNESVPGLGHTLMQLLSRQLGGRLERAECAGTRHLLRFPVAGDRARG